MFNSTDTPPVLLPRKWVNADYNFDNLLTAIQARLCACVGERASGVLAGVRADVRVCAS